MKLRTYFYQKSKKIKAWFIKGRKDVDEAIQRRKEEIDDNFDVEKQKPRLLGRISTGSQ
jgi:hypothetical protein